jgi:hypothetical protein
MHVCEHADAQAKVEPPYFVAYITFFLWLTHPGTFLITNQDHIALSITWTL